jgi:hypothetical protein
VARRRLERHQRWVVARGQAVNVVDLGPRDGEVLLFVHATPPAGSTGSSSSPSSPRPIAASRWTSRASAGRPCRTRSPWRATPGRSTRSARSSASPAACVVGNSMGGFVASELAISFPQRVERPSSSRPPASAEVHRPADRGHPPPGGVMLGRVPLRDGRPHRRAVPRPLAARPRGRRTAIGFVVTRARSSIRRSYGSCSRGAGRPAAAAAAVDLATYDFRERSRTSPARPSSSGRPGRLVPGQLRRGDERAIRTPAASCTRHAPADARATRALQTPTCGVPRRAAREGGPGSREQRGVGRPAGAGRAPCTVCCATSTCRERRRGACRRAETQGGVRSRSWRCWGPRPRCRRRRGRRDGALRGDPRTPAPACWPAASATTASAPSAARTSSTATRATTGWTGHGADKVDGGTGNDRLAAASTTTCSTGADGTTSSGGPRPRLPRGARFGNDRLLDGGDGDDYIDGNRGATSSSSAAWATTSCA